MIITGGEIIVEPSQGAPNLLVTMFRMSLVDSAGGVTFPLTRQMLESPTSVTSEDKEIDDRRVSSKPLESEASNKGS